MIYIQALAIVGGRKNNNNERTNIGEKAIMHSLNFKRSNYLYLHQRIEYRPTYNHFN